MDAWIRMAMLIAACALGPALAMAEEDAADSFETPVTTSAMNHIPPRRIHMPESRGGLTEKSQVTKPI